MRLASVERSLFPATVEEAAEFLQEEGECAAVVGGGLGIATARELSPKTLIFLEKLPLKYVKEDDEYIKAGARVSLSEFIDSPILEKYLSGKVKFALSGISTHLIRNQMTLGGAVAGRAPYSDIVPLFMALKADIALVGPEGPRTVFIDEYYRDFQIFKHRYVIEEIRLPKGRGNLSFAFERFTRNATDIPLLNLSILLKEEEGRISEASIAVGSRPGPAYRFREGEEFLEKKALSKDLVDSFEDFIKEKVDVQKDFRMNEDFRRHICGVFARRALESMGGAL